MEYRRNRKNRKKTTFCNNIHSENLNLVCIKKNKHINKDWRFYIMFEPFVMNKETHKGGVRYLYIVLVKTPNLPRVTKEKKN